MAGSASLFALGVGCGDGADTHGPAGDHDASEHGAGEPGELSVPSASAAASVSGSASASAAASAAASTASSTAAAASPPTAPVDKLKGRDLELDFRSAGQVFTPAFDGSQRFGMWLDTMGFARDIERKHGNRPRYTYFINSCYYALDVEKSGIGKVKSYHELLVRRALTQIAINEGHEIANHTVRHHDGSMWDRDAWEKEIVEFENAIESALFVPAYDDEGRALFPRFDPLDVDAGEVGAACSNDGDCTSGVCAAIDAHTSLCSSPCNRKIACPADTYCGAPNFHDDTDLCLPRPRLPLVVDGEQLFDQYGNPNRKSPKLKPYAVVGFRAPFLGYNHHLVDVLIERGYTYDTSIVLPPGPPVELGVEGATGTLLEFALMTPPDALTVPMDYNYHQVGGGEDRMVSDYESGLVLAASSGKRPWNVGHHFALWRDGAYWNALKRTIAIAAQGCPDDEGKQRCPGLRFLTFRELATQTRAMMQAQAAASGDADALVTGRFTPAPQAGGHAE